MAYTEISSCRICGNDKLVEVVDLGVQSLTGVFPSRVDQVITEGPLKLVKCHGGSDVCHLLQLQHSYDLSELYGQNYGYRSGLNAGMVNHLKSKVVQLMSKITLRANDVVIDVGSNDGTTLGFYPRGGWDLIGIDPTGEKFSEFYKDDVELIPTFFNASDLRKKIGGSRARIITSFSMFYDLEDPVQFAREIASVLSPDGVWLLEQSYMPTMLEKTSYDTICHEHLEYYGLSQIDWIVKQVGMKIVDVDFNDVNGGSFSVTVVIDESSLIPEQVKIDKILKEEQKFRSLELYYAFSKRVKESKVYLREILGDIKKSGKSIFGLGASTKGNVILQYCCIEADLLPFVGEINHDKFNKFTPGSLIPIIPEDQMLEKQPDFILVLPWHFFHFFELSDKFKNTKLILPLGAP